MKNYQILILKWSGQDYNVSLEGCEKTGISSAETFESIQDAVDYINCSGGNKCEGMLYEIVTLTDSEAIHHKSIYGGRCLLKY